MNKRIAEFEKMIETKYDNIAGIAVLRDGKTVYGHYTTIAAKPAASMCTQSQKVLFLF